MKKDSSKLSLQKFAKQQLSSSQTAQVKGGNGSSTDTTNTIDIIITDPVLL